MSNRPPKTFGSLFSGIGGFDIGLEQSGLNCLWQCESDPFCRLILQARWPEVPCYPDVRTCLGNRCDIIAGGFPCQDISSAGNRSGIRGERSGLFWDAMRIVRDLRPAIVLLENVAALRFRGLDAVLGALAECRYDAEWGCLPAIAVGAAHQRNRLFVLAYDPARVRYAMCLGPQTGRRSWTQIANGRRSGFGHGPWGTTDCPVRRVVDGRQSRLDRSRKQALGNAVVPDVARWIGERIVSQLRIVEPAT